MHKITNTSIIKIILLIIFTSTLFSSTTQIYENIEKLKLYEHPYWKKLLHYKNGQSEIDSANFFISKEGKNNLKKELQTTITDLINGEKNSLCRFPLRVDWLTKKLPLLKKQIKTYTCKNLTKYIQKMNHSYMTLVFPTENINSPASMYGHTFLKLSKSKENFNDTLALNYTAERNDSNSLLLAYNGLFGGYYGKYSISPYYKKLYTYTNVEQRDVWEYDLDFTQEEVKRVILHAYELKDTRSYYYFFSENCSYNILWFLEIARPNLNLINQFNLYATPLDTIKAVKSCNIITNSSYKPSKIKEIQSSLKNIKNPIYSHNSRKIELSKINSNTLNLTFKPVYTDMSDVSDGYIQGAYIDFFKFDINLKKDKFTFNKFTLFNIESYPSINSLFKPLSWGIKTSYKRFKKQEGYINLYHQAGLTLSNNKDFLYIIGLSNYYTKVHSNLLSLGGKIGFFTNRFKNFKFATSYSYEKYNLKDENKIFETFGTYKVNKNLALNVNYSINNFKEKKDLLKFSIFFYF